MVSAIGIGASFGVLLGIGFEDFAVVKWSLSAA